MGDPTDPQHLLEGGLLQFAVTYAAPDVLASLQQAIQKRTQDSGPFDLAALPLKSAEVSIYKPDSGDLIGNGALGEGIAPTFASQKMVFALTLTKLGTDVYESLVNSATGVPIIMTFTYQGLTPAVGLNVTVDWDQTYQYYSSN
jgi:hypothetical protein